jgi:RNA polymerase sigma factor (sigma-70 family)
MAKNVPENLLHHIRHLAGMLRAKSSSDTELLAAFVGGDQRAFDALVVRHGPPVWDACQRILGDTPDAEDAFQATFIALAQQVRRIRPEALARWLHQTAHQSALMIRRSSQRRGRMHRRLASEVRSPVSHAPGDVDEERALVREELRPYPRSCGCR